MAEATFPTRKVFAAIGHILQWPYDDLIALHGRLKAFRKIDFPPGLPQPGRGREDRYTFEQAFDLLAAMHLNMGIVRQHAVDQYMDKRETFLRTARAGNTIHYRPRSALADLMEGDDRRAHRSCSCIWNVGALWRGLADELNCDMEGRPKA